MLVLLRMQWHNLVDTQLVKRLKQWKRYAVYRVFHNCWNKAIGHKSRILNDTTMMITFIERWKDNIL